VQQLTRFRLTQRVALSVCGNKASRNILWLGLQGNVSTVMHMLPQYPTAEICKNPPKYPQPTKLRYHTLMGVLARY